MNTKPNTMGTTSYLGRAFALHELIRKQITNCRYAAWRERKSLPYIAARATHQIIWVLCHSVWCVPPKSFGCFATLFGVYHPNHLGTCSLVWIQPPKPFGWLPIGLALTTQIIWVLCHSVWCVPPKSFGYLPIGLALTTQIIWVPIHRYGVDHPNHLGACPSVWH